MSGSEQTITIHIKYGEVEQTITGDVNTAWISVNKFFSETIPTFDIARKVTLMVDLSKLVEDFKDIIAIAPEGPELLISRDKLTDIENLQFHLLAAYIGHRLGKLPNDTATKEELRAKLGKNMKITTTRLGELVKQGSVIKTEKGSYRITTKAIMQLQKEQLPRKLLKCMPTKDSKAR